MMSVKKKISYLTGVLLVAFVSTSYAVPAINAPSVFANAPATNVTESTSAVALNPVPPALTSHGYYLMDVNSGKVLATSNPDQRMAPASLTKLMTLYLTFEALSEGRIHLNDQVVVSKDAWQTGGSRMFLTPGSSVSVEDLIKGVIVDSGNDACVALSEYVGGSEPNFVNLMNQQAALLGMVNTHYMDCTGLPDPNHYSTPHDLAILSRAVILNFPQYYPYFNIKELTYNKITQPNRNRLLWSDPSVDGLKTGHTDEAGYCLISSANRNGMRLLSVLLGAPTDPQRDSESETLLNYGFQFYSSHLIYGANKSVEDARVWFSQDHTVPVGLGSDMYITVTKGTYPKVAIKTVLNNPLKAPLAKGAVVGTVTATLDGNVVGTQNLVTLAAAPEGNIWTRFMDHLKLFFERYL